MRKISILLSTLLLTALILAACGAEEGTNTPVVESPPPVTVDATDELMETPTGEATVEGDMTETPGVPVTGEQDPARLSNQLDFSVWSQDGEQVGDVNDMVLDMDNDRVMYVLVGAGGFLGLGEREVLVPWNSLELQTGTGDAIGGQENAFVLQQDVEIYQNAPEFDRDALPEMGQPATDWDVDIRTYWESGGTAGVATDTPAADASPAADATATLDTAVQATATIGVDQGQAGTGTDLQGVMLASDLLDATITVSGQGTAEPGTGTDLATATPGGTGTDLATATPALGTDPVAPGAEAIDANVDDVIVDTDTGDILYLVVDAFLDEGERWIPVPLDRVQWNANDQVFVVNTDAATLRDAPFFVDGQYPNTTEEGWDAEFESFWQNITSP